MRGLGQIFALLQVLPSSGSLARKEVNQKIRTCQYPKLSSFVELSTC